MTEIERKNKILRGKKKGCQKKYKGYHGELPKEGT